jgi:ADP-ribose pyrophosphatase
MKPDNSLEETPVVSKRIYEGRVINLRKDSVLLPSGKRFDREVVEHRGCAAAVPLLDEDTLVLVRQYRHPVGEVLVEIPAGTLRSGEDAEKCMQRELIEEIGYRPGKLEYLLTFYLAPGYSSEATHIYLATDLVKVGVDPDEDEFIEVIRLPVSEFLKLVSESKIKDAKTICGVLTYLLKKRSVGQG